MKKILTILAVLFTLNCSAQEYTYYQDTTYYLERQKLYQLVRSEVTDSSVKFKYEQDKLIRRKKLKRINRIAFGVFAVVTTTLIILTKP